MRRVLLPWEINHLRKYGFDQIDLDTIGTTPVEYITGHSEFRGLDFHVTPDCLIPRLETEKIVDICIEFLQQRTTPLVLADVGCGSGALGISLAHALTQNGVNNFHLYLSDISTKALQITQENVNTLIPHLKNSITILKSDLLSDYPKGIKIDCLVSNLPYIPSSRIQTLDPSVKNHEPVLALDGGTDGTLLINELLHQAPEYLNSHPLLVFEIDDSHKLSIFDIPDDLRAIIKKDDFDKNRYLLVTDK